MAGLAPGSPACPTTPPTLTPTVRNDAQRAGASRTSRAFLVSGLSGLPRCPSRIASIVCPNTAWRISSRARAGPGASSCALYTDCTTLHCTALHWRVAGCRIGQWSFWLWSAPIPSVPSRPIPTLPCPSPSPSSLAASPTSFSSTCVVYSRLLPFDHPNLSQHRFDLF